MTFWRSLVLPSVEMTMSALLESRKGMRLAPVTGTSSHFTPSAFGHLDVVPLDLLIGAHEAEGRVVLGDGHAQGAAGFDILQLIGAGCGMHAENQGSGYKESREHSGKFHGFPLIARCQNGALLQKELPEACQKYIFPAISERYKLKKMRSVRDLFLLR